MTWTAASALPGISGMTDTAGSLCPPYRRNPNTYPAVVPRGALIPERVVTIERATIVKQHFTRWLPAIAKTAVAKNAVTKTVAVAKNRRAALSVAGVAVLGGLAVGPVAVAAPVTSGPHAGAMFTLGESASGAVVLAAFGHVLDRAVPLPVTASVHFRKIAMGSVLATARLGGVPAEVLAELDAGQRPEFPVEVEVRTEDGTLTSSLTVIWTLRPNR